MCQWWLQWHLSERDGISNHWRLHCLLSCWFRPRSKKTLKLRVTTLCAGNSLVTSEIPPQKASNTENVSIWWCHLMVKFACTDEMVTINSVWCNDAIWWHRSGSIFVQVQACCLTVPSHYPNQWWPIISWVLCHSPNGNSAGNAHESYYYESFENCTFKIKATSSRGQRVKNEMTPTVFVITEFLLGIAHKVVVTYV